MTPLHILATSGHFVPDLLTTILDKYPADILWRKDFHDKTAMDYYLWNKSPRVVPLIQITLQRMIAEWLGPHCLQEWKSALSLRADSVVHCNFEERSNKYQEFCTLQDQLWKKEVTSVLELALWNLKMGPDIVLDAADRVTFHSICGTDSVIPNVAQYL